MPSIVITYRVGDLHSCRGMACFPSLPHSLTPHSLERLRPLPRRLCHRPHCINEDPDDADREAGCGAVGFGPAGHARRPLALPWRPAGEKGGNNDDNNTDNNNNDDNNTDDDHNDIHNHNTTTTTTNNNNNTNTTNNNDNNNINNIITH